MEVLHDYLPEHVGGAEVHAHQLARVLAARGHEVLALCSERDLARPAGHCVERHLDRMQCAMKGRLEHHRRWMKSAQRVIVPSYWLAEAMLAERVVAPEQLVHMEVGYPGPLREPRRPRPERPLRVGYIGGLFPSKGVTVLIQAMRQLGGEPIELAVHGPLAWYPEYVAELRSMAEGFPVRFRGRFEPTRIDRVLEEIDVLVVPSVWPENRPLSIHEAWRNGVPVIASDLGGMAECVTHGVNGLLFPRGDVRALADLLRDLERERAFVTRLALGRPQLVTVEGVAERLEGIYGQCIETVATC